MKPVNIILLLVAMLTAPYAVATTDFNPENPPEPNALYRIVVNTNMDDVDNISVSGSGSYCYNEIAYISTYCYNDFYRFDYWMHADTVYTYSRSFSYVMTDKEMTFTAHYTYTPQSPDEPVITQPQKRLTLKADPPSSCSFNTESGNLVTSGTEVWLSVYTNDFYTFEGWYDTRGTLISYDKEFEYIMPYRNDTLIARHRYTPSSPDEPNLPDEPRYATITTSVADDIGGTIQGGGTYLFGTTVRLVALPADGYIFTNWHDGIAENPRYIVLTQDTTITAAFAEYVPTATPHTPVAAPQIFTDGNTITITGAAGQPMALYDISGRLITTAATLSARHTITLPHTGTYIAVISGTPHKIHCP